MQCKNPYYEPNLGILCPCRQCLPCRINRRQDWATRAILEATEYKDSSFLTLTYNDDNIPLNGTLVPKHLQLFWKKLRNKQRVVINNKKMTIPGLKFRYFACGEYGEKSFRPHYHAIVYGIDATTLNFFASNHWDKGYVYCVPATVETMRYVAGYVTKKLAVRRDYLASGVEPEFIRTSLGIGKTAIEKLRNIALVQNNALDVISTFRIGGQNVRVPNYIKKKLREIVFDDEYLSKLKDARVYQMQTDVTERIFKWYEVKENRKELAIKSHLQEYKQHFLNIERKDSIWNTRSKV